MRCRSPGVSTTWLEERFPNADQFNSVHEKLIAYWKVLKPHLHKAPLHFSCVKETLEDLTTVEYLRDTAIQAGFTTKLVYLDDIGWDLDSHTYQDLEEEDIKNIFKLYPWEWMWHEQFGQYLALRTTQFIEPTWKMLLSNKGLLPILWELFPGHENLLPCHDRPEPSSALGAAAGAGWSGRFGRRL